MGTAFIREYPDIDSAPVEPGTDQTTVTTSGASAQSAAFAGNTRAIAISTPSGGAVCVKFGSNPTATTSHLRLPSNSVFIFCVSPGHKVALIDVT